MAGSPSPGVGEGFDPTVPNVARVYDYMLGGKDNFAVDRDLGDQLLAAFPESAWIARQNREFAARAVSYCAEQGVSQFLDIGSGLPTMDNVHEVARRVIPGARVVYVDNDKVANRHAEALLTTGDGVSAIFGDVRAPEQILADVRARRLLDLSQPFVVMMTALLHFITEDEKPDELVRVFKNAMPSGSFLVLTHATHDFAPEDSERATRMYPPRLSAAGNQVQDRHRGPVPRARHGRARTGPYLTLASARGEPRRSLPICSAASAASPRSAAARSG